jgi:hypothetical protein
VLTTAGAVTGTGAVPGEYHITFRKDRLPGQEALSKAFDEIAAKKLSPEEQAKELRKRMPQGRPVAVNVLPSKYASKTTTDIPPVKVERRKKNDFTFDLSSK